MSSSDELVASANTPYYIHQGASRITSTLITQNEVSRRLPTLNASWRPYVPQHVKHVVLGAYWLLRTGNFVDFGIP